MSQAVKDLDLHLRELAEGHARKSWRDIAMMIAVNTPKRRNQYSTSAKVPWQLIYAIHLKLEKEAREALAK